MRKIGHATPEKAPSERMLAATADLRRQLRVTNIVLGIVGIEAAVFELLRLFGRL